MLKRVGHSPRVSASGLIRISRRSRTIGGRGTPSLGSDWNAEAEKHPATTCATQNISNRSFTHSYTDGGKLHYSYSCPGAG